MNAPFSQIDLRGWQADATRFVKKGKSNCLQEQLSCLVENEKPKAIWPLLTLAVGRQQTVGKMTQIIYSHKDPLFYLDLCEAKGLHVKKDAAKQKRSKKSNLTCHCFSWLFVRRQAKNKAFSYSPARSPPPFLCCMMGTKGCSKTQKRRIRTSEHEKRPKKKSQSAFSSLAFLYDEVCMVCWQQQSA